MKAITHATILIDYHHIKHSFTTENIRKPPELITMTLVNGPFQNLDGHWRFIPLAENACKIEFRLHYTFAHIFLEKLVGPVFFMIANSFVEAFIQRAEDGLWRLLTRPIKIEVVYALPEHQIMRQLSLPSGNDSGAGRKISRNHPPVSGNRSFAKQAGHIRQAGQGRHSPA